MSDEPDRPLIKEGFERKPRSPKVLRSQARALIRKAENDGKFDDEDNLIAKIVEFARKTNVGAPDLAGYVIREAMRSDLV
jgi:hypothetical protein